MNDRAYKYFFISKNYDKLFNEDQKAFLRMVTENKASNKFTGKMLELLNNAKRNAQWRKQFMDLEREKTYAFDRGMEQKAIETAKKLLADGKYTAEEISALLQIPVESFAQPAPAN